MSQNSTFTLNPPSDLDPGDSYYWDLTSVKGGPANKKGYYSQFTPFDGVLIDSYTGVRLKVRSNGMETPIPGNSARTLDSNGVTFIEVINPSSGSTTVPKEDLRVVIFNDGGGSGGDTQNSTNPSFSTSQLAADLIPGVSR